MDTRKPLFLPGFHLGYPGLLSARILQVVRAGLWFWASPLVESLKQSSLSRYPRLAAIYA